MSINSVFTVLVVDGTTVSGTILVLLLHYVIPYCITVCTSTTVLSTTVCIHKIYSDWYGPPLQGAHASATSTMLG